MWVFPRGKPHFPRALQRLIGSAHTCTGTTKGSCTITLPRKRGALRSHSNSPHHSAGPQHGQVSGQAEGKVVSQEAQQSRRQKGVQSCALSSGTCPPDPERRHTALSSGRNVYKPWGVKDAPVSSACDHTGRHQILEERKTGQTTYEKTNICDDPQVWFQIKSPDRWDSLNRKRLFRGTRISGLEKAS